MPVVPALRRMRQKKKFGLEEEGLSGGKTAVWGMTRYTKRLKIMNYNEENNLLKQMLELGIRILKATLNIFYIFKNLK